jgi:hypothetical protein
MYLGREKKKIKKKKEKEKRTVFSFLKKIK